jgi:endoglucanase
LLGVGVMLASGCVGSGDTPARSDDQLRADQLAAAELPAVAAVSVTETETPMLRGVSLAGAEFGFDRYGVGVHGTDYIYPTEDYVWRYRSPAYFRGKGMNVFRLPFRWERLQPLRNAPFDAAEWRRLQRTVDRLTGLGAAVILDPHNFARYSGKIIGSRALPDADFADLWRRLAEAYKDSPNVIFGLMTEPYDMRTQQWVRAAQAAIDAIRAAGAENLILVPGNGWSAAHAWSKNENGMSNAVAMLEIRDPADNTAFEAHQYLDQDNSGSRSFCVSEDIGVQRLAPFTTWLKEHGKKGFLGEFGGGDSATCLAALAGMLDHVEANAGHYIGWTYWAAGPWWGDYFMSIEPVGRRDAPQMEVLARHLNGP